MKWVFGLPGLCVLLGMHPCLVHGQHVIHGFVTDAEARPLDACVVFLIHASTQLLADHTLTDEAGRFEVSAQDAGSYLLEFRNLAFRDTSIAIEVGKRQWDTLSVSLGEKIYDLPSIEIVDKLLGIRRSGDTLFYNIHAYTDDNELQVGDILNQLPGIEVTSSGQVMYMGKTIDALLVNGHDLTGNRHAYITEQMQADIVDGVQIWEKYQSAFDPGSTGATEDRIAMNIDLKKAARHAPVGNLSGGAGFRGRYLVRGNLLQSSSQNGFAFFAGASNHVRFPQDTDHRHLYDRDAVSRMGTRQFQFTDFFWLPEAIPDSRFREHYGRLTETNRSTSVWTRKTLVDLTGGRADHHTQRWRTRWADQSVEQSDLTRHQRSLRIKAAHDTRLQLTTDWSIWIKADSEWQLPENILDERGRIQDSLFALNAQADQKLTHRNLEGQSEWRFHKHHSLRMIAQRLQVRARSRRSVLTDHPFADYSVPVPGGKHSMQYAEEYDQLRQQYGFEWQWDRETIGLSVFSRYTLMTESLDVSFGQAGLEATTDRRLPIPEAGLKTRIIVGKIRLFGDLSVIRPGLGSGQHLNAYQVLPGLRLIRDLGRLGVMGLTARRQVQLPGLMYTHGLPMFQDHRTLSGFALQPDQLFPGWHVSASLKKLPGPQRGVWVVNLSTTWNRQSLVTQESFEGDYILRTVRVAPSQRAHRLTLFGWHTARQWKFTYNHFFVWTNGYGVLTGQSIQQRNLWTRTFLDVTFRGFPMLELSVAPEFQFHHQKIGGIQVDAINLVNSFQLRHVGKVFEVSLDFAHHLNRTQDRNLRVQNLNFSLGYRRFLPFRFYLEGTNVLNLNTLESLSAIINPVFAQSVLADRLPGSVLLVARYDF